MLIVTLKYLFKSYIERYVLKCWIYEMHVGTDYRMHYIA